MKNKLKYAKLIDNTLHYTPYPLIINGIPTWTNDENVFNEQGYYQVVETERPVKDGYFCVGTYQEQDGKIVRVWEEHEIPTVMEEVVDTEEKFDETPDTADEETTEIDGSEISV